MEEIVELQMKELREKKEELESQTFSFDEYFRRRRELKKTFRLSRESQMKIVEGCMDLVFDETRGYYQQLDKKISMEDIYYLCLESLISATKYCIHYTTKDCFRSYAVTFMCRNIVNYMAKKEGISYKNAYCIVFKLFDPDLYIYGNENMELYNVREFSFDYDKEIPYKPSAIYNMTKDKSYDADYIKDISSEEFMNTYNKAISELDDIDKKIMGLVYDKDGESVLTHAEIADILGIDVNKVINTKRKVKNRLRNDYHFDKYRE
jgi:RNA polymerase sigma factor (sigma-70 family)